LPVKNVTLVIKEARNKKLIQKFCWNILFSNLFLRYLTYQITLTKKHQ
jgi:hypothetical protein